LLDSKYKGSIKRRLIEIILIVTVLTGGIGYGSFVISYMEIEHKKSLLLANTVGNVLSQNIAKIILLNDVSAAADISSQLKSFQTLKSMALYKKNEKVIFQYSQSDKNFTPRPLPKNRDEFFNVEGNTLTLYIKAIYQNTHLGYVELKFKVDTVYDILKRDAKQLLIVFIIVSILSFFLALFYAKQFTSPILKLVKFLEKIEFVESIKDRIDTKEKNEYGKLYEEVNMMLERMEASKESLRIAAVAFETQSGMTITDANQKILRINQSFIDITGYTQEETLGQTPSILNSGRQDRNFYKRMHDSLEEFHHWSGEIYNRHKDGTVFPEYLTIQAVLDENNKIIYYVSSFVDLSIQKSSQKQLAYLKQYDPLTGLINREVFTSKIQDFIDTKKHKGWGCVIGFNIRDFKIFNDAYGHENGDILLQKIAHKLQEEFSNRSCIARVGTDEFSLWFKFLHADKNKASLFAQDLAQELNALLNEPIMIDSVATHTIVYSGIALYSEYDKDANDVLKHTNIALTTSKKEDKSISFFDEQAEAVALATLGTYRELLRAVELEEFELYYQMQYNNDSKIYGAEALIRWNHKDGIISPLKFIPIAEKTGLILPIGLWVIQSACKQLATWQKKDESKDWVIAINISTKQFMQDDFLYNIENNVAKSNINPKGLKLELTESVLVDNLDIVVEKMFQLHKIGIKISLDDFGTGYSSLQYLKNLPLDQVKIDQSFIRNMIDNESDIAVIKSVILLGEAMNFEVLAEGVETQEHYELLKDLGCQLFQGYYFAYPEKIEDIKV